MTFYWINILDGSTDFENILLRFEIHFKKRFNTLLYKIKDTFLKSLHIQYLFRTWSSCNCSWHFLLLLYIHYFWYCIQSPLHVKIWALKQNKFKEGEKKKNLHSHKQHHVLTCSLVAAFQTVPWKISVRMYMLWCHVKKTAREKKT